MRNHQSTTDDDAYDIIDGKKVLKDGARVHVTLMDAAMTPLQREIATKRARLTDGTGNYSKLAFSRPGRLTADAGAYDERQRCYDAYILEKQNEWPDGNRT
jgi:hypothetical protein